MDSKIKSLQNYLKYIIYKICYVSCSFVCVTLPLECFCEKCNLNIIQSLCKILKTLFESAIRLFEWKKQAIKIGVFSIKHYLCSIV